jgi:hypothetical protein
MTILKMLSVKFLTESCIFARTKYRVQSLSGSVPKIIDELNKLAEITRFVYSSHYIHMKLGN